MSNSPSPRTFAFPVCEDDRAHNIAPNTSAAMPQIDAYVGSPHSRKPPLPFNPPSSPSTRDSSPAKMSFGGQEFLSPSSASSRRGSQQSYDPDSRRGSAKSIAIDAMKDMRKGVRMVTDSTVQAGNKVKDKTASVSTSVKSATKGAGKWVATQSGKKAKAAMEQAKSGLSCTEKFTLYAAEKISMLSRRGFTHLFMFLMIVIYTAIGAALFMAVEGSHEDREKTHIVNERLNLIMTLWNDTKETQEYDDFKTKAVRMVDGFEKHLFHSFYVGISPYIEEKDWTFWKAMFFCSTITTTIGYGNVAPKTGWGQFLTIIYALIGIPLFLILLTDFGKLFTRILKQLFILLAKVGKTEAYKCTMEKGHDAVQSVSGRLHFITDKLGCNKRQSDVEDDDDDDENKSINPEDYFVDGNFNLPVSLALGMLCLYILIGSFVFTLWEDWSRFEAFYFIFVSMTTIGFGDYTPNHPAFMMGATVYLVFGLALTAMSINIIQEKLTDSFNDASVKLKETFKEAMATTSTEAEAEDDDEEGKA